MIKPVLPADPNAKRGEFRGRCAGENCKSAPAIFRHTETGLFYCPDCARLMNRNAGTLLCTIGRDTVNHANA